MKKTIFSVIAFALMGFAFSACESKPAVITETETDSTKVDTTKVDSAEVDTLTVDTLAVDSMVG